jgi:hypothetical protein
VRHTAESTGHQQGAVDPAVSGGPDPKGHPCNAAFSIKSNLVCNTSAVLD